MTRDEVLAMEPGYQLDNLVAQNMFGFFKGEEFAFVSSSGAATKWRNQSRNPQMVPKYSTDIAATWGVVEKMDDCLHLKQHGTNSNWEAFFCGAGSNKKATADTAPEAICKAALLAVLDRG